jgi:hypothetical protein
MAKPDSGSVMLPSALTMRIWPGYFSVTSILPSARKAMDQGSRNLSVTVVTL